MKKKILLLLSVISGIIKNGVLLSGITRRGLRDRIDRMRISGGRWNISVWRANMLGLGSSP